jgi:uncharacterized protein with ParB-like and HNH nuclease domain
LIFKAGVFTEYQKETIKNVVEKINSEYFLPDIQRSFVWKPAQIYALFDSIVRPYPISTFLFWELDKDFIVEKDVKLLTFVKSNKEESELNLSLGHDKYNLVLDGQQRLTSFYIALKGTYLERNKPKELYFDVFSGVEPNEDGLLYDFKLFIPDNGACFAEEEEDQNNKGKMKARLWINVKRIYEIPTGKAEDIRTFVEKTVESAGNKTILPKYASPRDLAGAVFDKVHDLYHSLTSSPVVNFYPERRRDYDAVLDIFVRTNSGGTKLSYSDLLFSKIKRHWDKARERFRELLEEINGNAFDFDGDFILKTCLVIFAETQTDVRYKIENLKEKKIDDIRQNWEKIAKTIKLTISIAKDYAGLTTSKLLPSKNALIPLVYFIFKNDIKMIGDHGGNTFRLSEIEKAKHWLYRIMLTGVFSGQSDSMLHQTKEILKGAGDTFPDADLNRQIQSVGKSLDVNKDFLGEIEYNSADSYLLLFLLYRGQKLKLNFNPIYEGETPQQDHIFSQDELRNAGHNEGLINDIGNIRYVSASENQWKNATPFSQWISQTSPEEKGTHLIPLGDWKIGDYENFLEKRKELMLQKLH